MNSHFSPFGKACSAVEPHLPKNQPGARRVDDRRVISGVLHVLKAGCRWFDCPAAYGPSTTVDNRFNRWSRRGFWLRLLDAGGRRRGDQEHGHRQHLHQSAGFGLWQKKGARAQAIGRSRGAWTTKIHALTDVVGRPFALMLTPRQPGRCDSRARAARPDGLRPLCAGGQRLRCRPAPPFAAPGQSRAGHPRPIEPQAHGSIRPLTLQGPPPDQE